MFIQLAMSYKRRGHKEALSDVELAEIIDNLDNNEDDFEDFSDDSIADLDFDAEGENSPYYQEVIDEEYAEGEQPSTSTVNRSTTAKVGKKATPIS